MPLPLRLLTIWNVLCPLAFAWLCLTWDYVGVDAFGRRASDLVGFVIAWAWIGTTPFTTGMALILNRRVRSRLVHWIAIVVLAAWAVFFAVAVVTPLGA